MPASFPSSFASAARDHATAAESTMRVALPPWLRPLNGFDPLPHSLDPILPPPVPSVHFQHTTMSRSSSKTDIDHDTVMSDVYHYEGDREDTDETLLERTNPSFANSPLRHSTATNYFEGRRHFSPELGDHEEDHFEFECESEEEVVEFVQRARARSVKEKKAAVINKHAATSRKHLVKTVKNKKKASKLPVPALPHLTRTLKMPASFPYSFVRSSSTERLSTLAETAIGATLPPRLRSHQDYEPLPRFFYPVLPPNAPYTHIHPIKMSRSPSNTETNPDTAMSDAYHTEGESEEEDDNNYGLDYRSEEESIPVAKPARTRSIKEKKKALKAADAIDKRSKNRSVKNAKHLKKAPVTGNQNAPARRTRSSTHAPPASTQIVDFPGIDAAQPSVKEALTRKAWLPHKKDILQAALVVWWHAEGADRYNHPTKMVLPNQNDVQAWDWISAECKALNGSFNRARGGVYIIARSMHMKDDLRPVSVPGESTARLRRRK
ncbi:hypothetical protein FRC04_001802 [Tulasnella sp. 424]|nr:hypothetical protein FRC04_001802 [Tulasnella sp. 424]